MQTFEIHILSHNPDVLARIMCLLRDTTPVDTDHSGRRHSTTITVVDAHGRDVLAQESTCATRTIREGEIDTLVALVDQSATLHPAIPAEIIGLARRLLLAAGVVDPSTGEPPDCLHIDEIAQLLGEMPSALSSREWVAIRLQRVCERLVAAWTADRFTAAVQSAKRTTRTAQIRAEQSDIEHITPCYWTSGLATIGSWLIADATR